MGHITKNRPMYTLYTLPGSRATAVEMVIAELGLDAEVFHIDITRNEHRSVEYKQINPRATIPALIDNDMVVTVCETVATMLYVADKHQAAFLAPPPGDPDRALLLDWLAYHSIEVQEPVKRSWYAHRYAETSEGEEIVRSQANSLFAERWHIVEKHLAENGPYHLGHRYSLVDIYLLITSTFSGQLAPGNFPAIAECIRLTRSRHAIKPLFEAHIAGLKRISRIGVPG